MSTIDVSFHRKELERIEQELADPQIVSNLKKLKDLTRKHSQFREIIEKSKELELLSGIVTENQEILATADEDQEFIEIAREEIADAEGKIPEIEKDLMALLLPKDPGDNANAIIEIRAGTGGEEASLFASELFRMYSRFAETKGWKLETMNTSYTGLGGLKEVTFGIEGDSIYACLKYEAGVHRVQRVPETETSGRIHTSAASVAVLPELEDVQVNIATNDIRVDVYRSSGPGGQSVNTTESAVRITHLATGLVVTCQDEKSQHKNKAKALRVLKARLHEKMLEEAESSRADQRRTMVRSGDRSEKIRTYNYPQNRVTDHRIHLTVHALEEILAGDLDRIINPLIEHDTQEKLKAQTKNES